MKTIETVSIQKVDEKTSKKNKPYLAIQTDKGKMSAWDGIIIDNIKSSLGKVCELEVERDGQWANVTKFIKVTEQKAVQMQNPNALVIDNRIKTDSGNRTREAADLTIAWLDKQKACTLDEALTVYEKFTEASSNNFIKAESYLQMGEVQADPKTDPSKPVVMQEADY